MEEYKLIATAAFGLEGIVAGELKRMGYENAKGFHGGATFLGTAKDAYLANLWLRCADRVLIELARFKAVTFDELFEGIKALAFSALLPKNASVYVTGMCAKSVLMSIRDVQAIAKKAIVEQMKQAYRINWLPEDGVKYHVDIHIHEDEVLVALNTSGAGLSRRGYRTYNAEAPLRETLAAAMVSTSPWRPWLPFYDPMCGSGTLCIEAAMILYDRAPGLYRPFDMEQWTDSPLLEGFSPQEVRAQALARFEAKKQELGTECRVFGSDMDLKVLRLAHTHVKQAHMEGLVIFSEALLKEAKLPTVSDGRSGVIVTNPPYGERLMDVQQAEQVYQELRGLIERSQDWGLSAITSNKNFERVYGKRADKKRRVFNGRIECEIFNYYPPRPPRDEA